MSIDFKASNVAPLEKQTRIGVGIHAGAKEGLTSKPSAAARR
jgi:hypothetical protein